MDKTCIKCNQMKEHSISPKGRVASYCKDCQSVYSKTHYQQNKQQHISRSNQNTKARRIVFRGYLDKVKDVPCVDCGNRYPPFVMEFDHVRGIKLFNVSDVLSRAGWNRLNEEVAKCDIVCANCHRLRTFSS